MDGESLSQAVTSALGLLVTGNHELWSIVGISFSVSLRAIVIAVPPALALAFALSYLRFPGRRAVLSVFQALMSVPAVVVGLTVYLLLSRSGPLGDLRLLFTQSAMVIAQILLSFPLLVAVAHAAIDAGDRRAWETALTLGAPRWRAVLTVMYDVRFGLLAALIAAFGRIIAEVGASMMVGGNIAHYTRNIPTAIALETSRGEFSQGIALGMVLLVLAFTLNLSLLFVQRRSERYA